MPETGMPETVRFEFLREFHGNKDPSLVVGSLHSVTQSRLRPKIELEGIAPTSGQRGTMIDL